MYNLHAHQVQEAPELCARRCILITPGTVIHCQFFMGRISVEKRKIPAAKLERISVLTSFDQKLRKGKKSTQKRRKSEPYHP